VFKRPTPPEGRSADERARAAAERAARRAAREGLPATPPPPESYAAAAGARGGPVAETPPPQHDPEPQHDSPPDEVPEVEPVHEPGPDPEPLHEPEPAGAARTPYEPQHVYEPEPVVPDPSAPAEEPPAASRMPEDDLWTDEYLLAEPVAEVPAAQPPTDPEPTSPQEAPAMPDSTQLYDTVPPAGGETEEWQLPDAEPQPAPRRAAPLPPRAPSVPARGERWRPRDRPPVAAAAPEPRRGRRLGSRLAALAGLLVIALGLFLFSAIFQPFHADGGRPVRVSIPAGADAGRIGDILAERGVIDSPGFFTVNATVTGRRGTLRPGAYTLATGMAYGDVLDALSRGPKAAKAIPTYDLTVVEGRSARETSARIAKTDMEGNYLAASRSRAALRQARELGLPRRARTSEGFLFPATYKLPEGTTAAQLVERQLQGYADNTAKISYARARRVNLTRYDVLIIASMVEREAQLDRERPLVASVIYNRLKQGIPLGIDATIRYATNNWTRPIRVSELEADGPYNTRLNRGLPPTPIGNPGLASIRAAAKPAKSDFLYYVVKPGSKGAHAFSETDAEFQRDVQRYNRARADSGGQAP